MINARDEFIEHIEDRTVKCAYIKYGYEYSYKEQTYHILPVEYTKEQCAQFLQSLDFEYDDGFGAQELFGTIWYTDGTWSERGEYDGSEWWEHLKLPPIPIECDKSIDNINRILLGEDPCIPE